MKPNLGPVDKTIRIIASVIIILLLVMNVLSGILIIPGLVLVVMLITTSAVGHCPIYGVLGLNTKKNLNDKAHSYYRNQKQFFGYN